MRNFQYYTPTRVVFGRGAENKAGKLVQQVGGARVLLHYGTGSVQRSGLLGRVSAALKAAGIASVELGGVQPNPRLALVYQGIELCRKEKIDFILPVGGGSAIDSAKAIAYGLADPDQGDVWDFYTGERTPQHITPLGCVLTIAAAGSEMSDSSVITNEATGQKIGLSSDLARPLFAVMNPELTVTVPAYHTAAGCADIMMHTLERYFTPENQTMTVTDAVAEALMRDVIDNTHILAREPDNYGARASIMWAGALSHNGLTGCGGGGGDWATHQLGHELSARYDLSHGASLTAMWSSWARYVYRANPGRFAQLAVNVMGLDALDTDEQTALAGIGEMEGFFWGIEMPTGFAEAGIAATDADLKALAQGCCRGGKRTIGAFQSLDEGDVLAIYRAARERVDT